MANKDIEIRIKATADTAALDAADAKISATRAKAAKPDKSSLPLTQEAMDAEAAARAHGRLASAHDQVARSGRNAGMGVLALSQGIEDAQYGIRAVLNNIPSLIMFMGGGAGLAGVISMAAVAASVLGPRLKELANGADDATIEVRNLLEAYRAANEQANEAIAIATRQIEAERELARETSNVSGAVAASIATINERVAALDRQREAVNAARAAEDEYAKALADLAQAKTGDDPVKREQARVEADRAERARKMQRAREDLAAEQSRLKAVGKASVDVLQSARGDIVGYLSGEQESRAAAAEATSQAERQKQYSEADKARAEAARKGKRPTEAATAENDAARARAAQKQFEAAAEEANARADAFAERAKNAESAVDGELKRMQSEQAKSMQRIRELERQIEILGKVEPVKAAAEDIRLKDVREKESSRGDKAWDSQIERLQRRELERQQDALDANAKNAAGQIFRSPSARRNPVARKIGEALEGGTTEEEIAKLTRELNEQAAMLPRMMVAYLKTLLGTLTAQAKEMETLRRQIKNNP